jgi:hypothetical protein
MARKDRVALLAREDLQPTYLRGGQRVEAKHWAMHLQRNGTRTSLTLDAPIREAAATKAREIYLFLKVHTWEEMIARFKPNRAEKKTNAADMTVGEFSC